MTRFVLSVLLLVSIKAYAGGSIDAPGKVFYKMPDESIVKREVVLSVPSRGEGSVYLKAGETCIEAERFFSREINGRTVFYVVFNPFPGNSSDEDKAIVYRGTYTRGTNLAMYYGDVFKVNKEVSTDEEIHYQLSALDVNGSSQYVAGFYFKYEIE